MRKPKNILLKLAGMVGNLDEELARLALLRSQGKLLLPAGEKVHPKGRSIRAKIDFFRAMIKISDSGCWEWQGQVGRNFYGVMEIGCLTIRPHRFSFVIFNGREPEHCVCHHCDNRRCVNPDHFFDGTYRDNRRDCVRKNRHSPPKGELNHKAKLTEANVREIRASKERTIVLAQKFGVSPESIQNVMAGRTWSHLLPTHDY